VHGAPNCIFSNQQHDKLHTGFSQQQQKLHTGCVQLGHYIEMMSAQTLFFSDRRRFII
jgi:hypothetical protein